MDEVIKGPTFSYKLSDYPELSKYKSDALYEDLFEFSQAVRANERNHWAKMIISIIDNGGDITAIRNLCERISVIEEITDTVTETQNCIECGELVGEHEIIKNCHGSCRIEI